VVEPLLRQPARLAPQGQPDLLLGRLARTGASLLIGLGDLGRRGVGPETASIAEQATIASMGLPSDPEIREFLSISIARRATATGKAASNGTSRGSGSVLSWTRAAADPAKSRRPRPRPGCRPLDRVGLHRLDRGHPAEGPDRVAGLEVAGHHPAPAATQNRWKWLETIESPLSPIR